MKINSMFKCKLLCDWHYDILKYTSMQYSSRKPLASIKCYDSVSDIISWIDTQIISTLISLLEALLYEVHSDSSFSYTFSAGQL
jgi:hypothetical protein